MNTITTQLADDASNPSRYCVTVEYKTTFSTRHAPVNVRATDCEGAERVARNYASEQMGEVVRIISVVKLHDPA